VLLVVVGIMLLQTAWILTVPPFRAIDEIDHTYRAAAVARGQWTAGPAAVHGRGEQVTVPASIVDAAHAQCEELAYNQPENCNPISSDASGNVVIASSAGTYYPPFYWVVGTAALPFDGAGALYAMRVAAALLCSVFIALAAWSLCQFSSRWPIAALTLAATPVLVYSTTVVAPNGLEISAALALWASLLTLVRRPHEVPAAKLLWVAIISATVLGSLRALGPIFILLIVATVALLMPRETVAVIRSRPRIVAFGCVLVGTAVALFAAWTLGPVTSVLEADELEDHSGFKPINLVMWAMQSIAAFPFRDQQGPWIVYPVIGTLVVLLVVIAFREGTRRERAALSSAIVIAVVLPLAFTLATLDNVGDIWQGRYGLPYAVGVLLLAGVIRSQHHPAAAPSWKVSGSTGVLYAVAVVACLLKVRADELNQNEASVADPTWSAPAPLVLVVLVATATTLLVVGLSGTPHRSAAPTPGSRSARDIEALT